MATRSTWADGLIIQAVADKFNVKIYIVETNLCKGLHSDSHKTEEIQLSHLPGQHSLVAK